MVSTAKHLVCVMFQYATPANIEAIQSQLLSYFDTTIVSRQALHDQLSKSIGLLQYSKREIVHSIVQSHLKTLLCTKHHLFQTEDLTSLGQSLGNQITTFASNRFILSSFIQINALISTLGWTQSEEFKTRYSELLEDADSISPSPYTLPSLLALLIEINPDSSSLKNYSRHRKTGRIT